MKEMNERLLKYSIFLLSRRDYSEKELRKKYKEKEYLEDDVNIVLNYLKENNYQSDERFTRSFINSKLSKMGIKKIKSHLSFEKGITKEVIEHVLDDMELNEINTVIRLLESKYRNKDLTDHKEKSKAFRYLVSKGFSFDDINNAIDELKNRT